MNKIHNTSDQFDAVIKSCRNLFEKKTKDYGTSWRILRLPSLTDQVFIKANRIRSIQEAGTQKVGDSIRSEFIGIINYCIIALIQSHMINYDKEKAKDEKEEDDLINYSYNAGKEFILELEAAITMDYYDLIVENTKSLLEKKNHDYGEAWRDMRISSITDLILMKLLRIKQIEDNDGKTLVSEPVEAGYQDMINYSVFSLILMDQNDI